MPCRNITQLPKPPKRYRIGKLSRRNRRMETKFEAQGETLIRIARLRQMADKGTDRKSAKRCIGLANKLWRCWQLKDRCGSTACPLCMRRQRKRIGGWLLKLVKEDEQGHPVTATVLPRGWTMDRAS